MARKKTSDEERKRKQREAQRKSYYKYRDKKLDWLKKYRQRPEVKERHRLWMARWRKENHDKSLEISRRSWKKNGDKQNKKRTEKYWSDPSYKKLIKERERKYKATGRRQFVHKRRYALKTEEIKKKSADWKKNNYGRVRKYVTKYRADVQIYKERKQRATLDDRYVVNVIKKSLDYKIKTKDIPKELIELQRIKILTHRKLKQKT